MTKGALPQQFESVDDLHQQVPDRAAWLAPEASSLLITNVPRVADQLTAREDHDPPIGSSMGVVSRYSLLILRALFSSFSASKRNFAICSGLS
jgi:hypothetical protein